MGKFSRKIQRGMRTAKQGREGRKRFRKRFRKAGKFNRNLKRRYGREGSKH